MSPDRIRAPRAGDFRDLRAARVARKLVGNANYEGAAKTTSGQSALDALVLAIMNFFKRKASKSDVGCFAETVIDIKHRQGQSEGGGEGKNGRRTTGPRNPGGPS